MVCRLSSAWKFPVNLRLHAELANEAEEEQLRKSPNVVPFPDPPDGMLFAIADNRDRDAHERLSELLEDVLATAPRRMSQGAKPQREKRVKVGLSFLDAQDL